MIGKVFTDRGDWKIECDFGTYYVKDGGFNDGVHTVLRRGKDEGKIVEFELNKYNEAIGITLWR